MAVSLRKQIAQNKRNTILMMLIFIAFVSLIGGLFAWLFNDISILIWMSVISIIYTLIQYFLSDKIAILSAGAHQVDENACPRLHKVVAKIAEDAKIPKPKVYIVQDSAPNAFATGRDYEHACVAATTGLLDIMDDNELRAVMAHEMSHVKNYDIRVSMIACGLASIVGLISDLGLRIYIGSRRDDRDSSPIAFLALLLTAIFAPLIAVIVQLAISRQREYLADASAANIIGNSEDMVSALRKLDTHARPMRQQNASMESMYIANPLRKSFVGKLFSTHPSIESRIERLEDAK